MGRFHTPPLTMRKAWLRTFRFPYGYELTALNLATQPHSLPRFSKRTAEPCGQNPFRALPGCSRMVSGSFHPLLRVLFSFPSRYWYAIGLGEYLGLGVPVPHLPVAFPSHGTPCVPSPYELSPTGLSPSTAGLSRPLRLAHLGD